MAGNQMGGLAMRRRTFLLASAAVLAASPAAAYARAGKEFVTRQGMRLVRNGAPYRVVGANLWYAAWLGQPGARGDRARLGRELDRLAALGINNLRIMASAEEGPLKGAMRPGFTAPDGAERPALYEGLDHAMAEIAKRDMTAVLVLGNFWEWSGGLGTLLYRVTGDYVDMNDPDRPWPAYPDWVAGVYANEEAVAAYHSTVRALVARRNTVTGDLYAEDPAILSWQLANEPRPGGSAAAIGRNENAYLAWVRETAALIRSLDSNHLVSLGQEGTQATNGREDLVRAAHEAVDYVTAHIWPNNWGWVDGDDLEGTWPEAREKTRDYIDAHERIAAALGKPLLIEEFGFPREGEALNPDDPAVIRGRFYGTVYEAVEASWREGGPLQGSNFWAWNGEGRAARDDHRYAIGDPPAALLGDPPHEPQGWYGLYDTDGPLLIQIREHVRAAHAIPAASAASPG